MQGSEASLVDEEKHTPTGSFRSSELSTGDQLEVPDSQARITNELKLSDLDLKNLKHLHHSAEPPCHPLRAPPLRHVASFTGRRCLVQGGCIIHAIARHGSYLAHALDGLDNLLRTEEITTADLAAPLPGNPPKNLDC